MPAEREAVAAERPKTAPVPELVPVVVAATEAAVACSIPPVEPVIIAPAGSPAVVSSIPAVVPCIELALLLVAFAACKG